jgi:hypothetical protein
MKLRRRAQENFRKRIVPHHTLFVSQDEHFSFLTSIDSAGVHGERQPLPIGLSELHNPRE